MKDTKKPCANLMRVGPLFPGLYDESEGVDKIATATYTCVKTGTPVGPDADIANPDVCDDHRSCFKIVD